MKINGVIDIKNDSLKIKKNNQTKKISDKEKIIQDMASINITSSKTSISSFSDARKMVTGLTEGIIDKGSDIIDMKKLSGSKIFDLLN
ncbi:MAG: hypothetical protein WC002_06445 [Candidatus Muiribacteriota bacterium]